MPKERTKRSHRHEERVDRHKQLMQAYLKRKNAPMPTSFIPSDYKTEKDIVRENHKFVRSDDENNLTWEERVAKSYYDRLYKEYALCNLKYYKEGKIALRWRTEKEVVLGKGQFICGSTHCEETEHLKSWEVNFGYVEDGKKKNELVKVRLCERCSEKLNYKTIKKRARKDSREKRREKKRIQTEEEDFDHEKKGETSDDKIDTTTENKLDDESSVWSKKAEVREEQSREEEYEDYFADLLQ